MFSTPYSCTSPAAQMLADDEIISFALARAGMMFGRIISSPSSLSRPNLVSSERTLSLTPERIVIMTRRLARSHRLRRFLMPVESMNVTLRMRRIRTLVLLRPREPIARAKKRAKVMIFLFPANGGQLIDLYSVRENLLLAHDDSARLGVV